MNQKKTGRVNRCILYMMEADFTASGISGKCSISSGAVGIYTKSENVQFFKLKNATFTVSIVQRPCLFITCWVHDHPSREKSMHRTMILIESYYKYIIKHGLSFIISIFP
jgi:hypothetical protein